MKSSGLNLDYKVWVLLQQHDNFNCTLILHVAALKWHLIAAWSGLQWHVIDKAIDQWCGQLQACVTAHK